MQVLVVLCLALLRCAAMKDQLCDAGFCSCDRTWGRFNCSCSSTHTKELILKPSTVPDNTVHLRIENCSRVHVMSHTWENHRETRRLEFVNIDNLVLESNAFSWNETLALEPVPQSGLEVNIVNSSIPEIPSYTFKGRLIGITLQNVTIGSVHAFAFASLHNTEKLEFIQCVVTNFEAQAFKKFSVEKLHIVGGHFYGSVPSRTMVDIEVRHDLLIERVFINNIRSSAFIIHGTKNFHLRDNLFENVEGEAFHIRMKGKALIQNNVFHSLARGAFFHINVERFIIKMKGLQVLKFENNTIGHFENGCLLFNTTSFNVQLDQVILNQTCSCVLLDTWGLQLNIHSSHSNEEQMQQYSSGVSDKFWCRLDMEEKQERRYIHFKDFNQQCSLSSGVHIFLIIIVTVSLILLAVILLVVFICCRRRSHNQRHWINVPSTPNNDSKKTKMNSKSGSAQKRGKNEQDARITMVVPDGRIYRETELHVIVERTEPIMEHDYVDTAIDERSMKNRL